MAVVTVNGDVLWTKHIHGDQALRERLRSLDGGHDVELAVDGVRGYWRKMARGRDGRPTAGLQPLGRMQEFWRGLNATRRGEEVSLTEAEPVGSNVYPALGKTMEERQAALRQLLSIRGVSEPGWKFNRQEIYDERDDELAARREAAAQRDLRPQTSASATIGSGVVERSEAAVAAARAAFLTPRGWSSEGRTVTRDELYER